MSINADLNLAQGLAAWLADHLSSCDPTAEDSGISDALVYLACAVGSVCYSEILPSDPAAADRAASMIFFPLSRLGDPAWVCWDRARASWVAVPVLE